MRLLRTMVPALLALLLLGMAAPVAAQSDNEVDASDFANIEGLQRAYSRIFSPDIMSMFNPATPEATPTGWFLLNTIAMEFDTEEHAAAAIDTLVQDIDAGDLGDVGLQFEDATLDVDFDYTAKRATQSDSGMTVNVLLALTQDGTRVSAVVGLTMGDDPAPVVTQALTTMRDASAAGGEGTFSEDGTSDGGLWDALPTLEQMQELSPDFVEASDVIAFPVPEGTPAA